MFLSRHSRTEELTARGYISSSLQTVATMLKLSLDIDMIDVSSTSTTDDRIYGTFTHDDVRSPRTPTYVPTSPTSSKVTAFNLSRIFSSPETSVTGSSPTNLFPEPAKPLAWIWQCHLCKSRYSLGVTRRCLQDGHFYCSSETDRPNLKRKKSGQSCSSEFDYIGWREWGEWKRKVFGTPENGVEARDFRKDCEKCEYPSRCRHTAGHASAQSHAVNEERTEASSDSPMAEAYQVFSVTNEEKRLCINSTRYLSLRQQSRNN